MRNKKPFWMEKKKKEETVAPNLSVVTRENGRAWEGNEGVQLF